MMLYLCGHDNVNLFDWLNESSLVEQPFMLKKISSNQLDLSSFAKKEALSINYYKYLAIDLSAVTNDSENFRTALQSIKMMNPKIKFLYVDIGNRVQALQDAIRSLGDEPLITAEPKEHNQFKTEVALSLQYLPVNKETEKKKAEGPENVPLYAADDGSAGTTGSRKEYIFEGKDVRIAVINAYTKAGATTLGINMANYLRSIGASVAYVECNGEMNHLEQLRNSSPEFQTAEENRFSRNGVIYMTDLVPDGFDFIICDMSGIIQDDSESMALEFIAESSIIILCGTSKPYELQEISNKLKILQDNDCNKICLCLAFTPENEKAHLIDRFGTKDVSVYFTGYTPNMFKSNANSEMFKRICRDYIKEKSNDKMLKLF